jgi:hypothetical protein
VPPPVMRATLLAAMFFLPGEYFCWLEIYPVMPALVAGIHIFKSVPCVKGGWPGRARP